MTQLMNQIKRSSLKQWAIARATGVTEWRLSKLANGHFQPRDTEKAALAKFFRMPIDKLFPSNEQQG
jgi:Helix-turn-helix.